MKNIPADLYLLIKKSASLNFRSINSEILFHLNKTFGHKPNNPEQLLERIEKLQKKISLPQLSDEIFELAKNEGRL